MEISDEHHYVREPLLAAKYNVNGPQNQTKESFILYLPIFVIFIITGCNLVLSFA